MRRAICLVLVTMSFLLNSLMGIAVPAYPRNVILRLIDGTDVLVSLKGDEYNKWALTTDNYTLLPSGNEWYLLMADSMGNAVRSSYKLCADAERPESLRRFLAQQAERVASYGGRSSKEEAIVQK